MYKFVSDLETSEMSYGVQFQMEQSSRLNMDLNVPSGTSWQPIADNSSQLREVLLETKDLIKCTLKSGSGVVSSGNYMCYGC